MEITVKDEEHFRRLLITPIKGDLTMEDLEELKQEAQKAFEIVEKIDNELTKILNENPTDSETTKKSILIWHVLEKLREFLGV